MTQAEKTQKKTEVFVNRRKLELHQAEITGAELLQAAGFEGAEWDRARAIPRVASSSRQIRPSTSRTASGSA